MMGPAHEFDHLNRWALLPDAEIELLISDETIQLLQRATDLLSDEHQEPKIIARENFVSTVREMRTLYAEGSRALGAAILEASEYLKKQKSAQAKETYKRFLASCKSKFYRNIARQQLTELEEYKGDAI